MQLSLADLRDLPLAAALVERGGTPVAHTPEWEGTGPGCVAYPVRGKRLLVSTAPADLTARAVLQELLAALDSAVAKASGAHAMRMRMVAASLRLLAGDAVSAAGTTVDAYEHALAGIAARTSLRARVGDASVEPIPSPEVVALVLVQLAVNAERHGQARTVELTNRGATFSVAWRDSGRAHPRVSTARRRGERERWGLGFARVAADALGGTVYPPRHEGGGTVAVFELGLGRLGLPLALVRGDVVLRATRAWDEETSLVPGTNVRDTTRLAALAAAARVHPGAVARSDGWSARLVHDSLWVAVPPDDVADRMRDVLDGMAHERALLEGMDEAARVRIRALTLALGACLGRPVPRVPAAAWRQRMHGLSEALDVRLAVPDFEGTGAVDPDVAAVLAARAGAGFDIDGNAMWLRLNDAADDDPMVHALTPPGAHRVRLA